MTGKLYLIPNTLGPSGPEFVLPEKVFQIIRGLNYFIVENVRNARRFIIQCGYTQLIDEIRFYELNKHTNPRELITYLDICEKGTDIGLISEAGVPGVADPGADIVSLAHSKGIRVIPLVGPSSILMALMASGMNGQNFCFHGYLPIKGHERTRKIKELETAALKTRQTQIFIETPYRNNTLIEDLIKTCHPGTKLCIACDISLESELVLSLDIANWKKRKTDLHKRPCVFLIGK